MSGQFIDFECVECQNHSQVRYGDEETDDNGNLICGECNSPPTWDDIDFPVWVDHEFYDDTFGLLLSFQNKFDVSDEGLPHHVTQSGSDFKYTVERFWYKIHEDGTVEGPYDNNHEKIE